MSVTGAAGGAGGTGGTGGTTSTGSTGPVAATTVLLQPMPIPRTVGAPLFDGNFVRDFISIMERHGTIAGLQTDALPKLVLQYCTEDVKNTIRWCDELDGTDWSKATELLLTLYGARDQPVRVTVDTLRNYIRDCRGRKEFTKRTDVDKYHQGYLAIAGQLKKNQEITEKEMKLKFLYGLPSATRNFVTNRLPDANMDVNNPPTITEVIAIISKRFNPKSIEAYGFDSEEEERVERDEAGRSHITIVPGAQITEPAKLPSLPQNPTDSRSSQRTDIKNLTQQLQQLSLNQAQILSALNSRSPPSNSSQTNMTSAGKRCFICGLSGTHQLHPRYCPEMASLMAEGLAVFLPDRQRYALPDGSDLPVLPYFSGGIAKFLRDQRTCTTSVGAQPHIATTKTGMLYIGPTQAFQNREGTISISADDYDSLIDTNAVTRTGKDTSSRTAPYKRPEAGASKSREPAFPSAIKNLKTPAPAPAANTQSPPQATTNTLPKPHPINTEEGWKEVKSKAKSKDVEMKAPREENKRGTPQYYFTSDVQEQVSTDDIMKKILDQSLTLSLKEIIGMSPALQKKFSEMTKTRREYTTKTGEYELFSPEVEQSLSQVNADNVQEVRRTLYVPEDDCFQAFMVRYSNAVQMRPTKLLAMTTGIFSAKMCGETIKFLVDTGSELNLIPERLLKLPGMALDFEGSRWALKGVNGAPVSLKGCCMDVPINIGGHAFDHHFFVSREEIQHHDAILRQPWIQWYAARIDFNREGEMKMMVWHDGDRSNQPTLQLQLTIPDDPCNVTTFRRHAHFAHVEQEEDEQRSFGPQSSFSASIEDVEDEPDFQ